MNTSVLTVWHHRDSIFEQELYSAARSVKHDMTRHSFDIKTNADDQSALPEHSLCRHQLVECGDGQWPHLAEDTAQHDMNGARWQTPITASPGAAHLQSIRCGPAYQGEQSPHGDAKIRHSHE